MECDWVVYMNGHEYFRSSKRYLAEMVASAYTGEQDVWVESVPIHEEEDQEEMHQYDMKFNVSGSITVKAESMTAAVDKVAEYFRDSGMNQLHVKTVMIDGDKVEQERKQGEKDDR